MKDRFKFRAVLSANGLTILVTPAQIYTDGYMINIDEANDIFEKKYPNESTWEFWDEIQKQGDVQEHYHADLLIVKCFEKFIQCTDKKDNNGKLIFEGDIVASDYKRKPDYEIIYSPHRKQLVARHHFVKYGEKTYNDFDLFTRSLEYIIGNIYENPELLENNS